MLRDDIPNVEESRNTEDVVTPLVVAVHEGADETSNDHDDGHEQCGHNVGERKAGSEQKLKEQQREGDEPLDVPHILSKAASESHRRCNER